MKHSSRLQRLKIDARPRLCAIVPDYPWNIIKLARRARKSARAEFRGGFESINHGSPHA